MTTKNVTTQRLNSIGAFRATLPQKSYGESAEVFIRVSAVSAITGVPQDIDGVEESKIRTAIAFIGEDNLTYVEEDIEEVIRRIEEAQLAS